MGEILGLLTVPLSLSIFLKFFAGLSHGLMECWFKLLVYQGISLSDLRLSSLSGWEDCLLLYFI